MNPDEITSHLLRRAQWSASRSSGPGGQHRDKASTRAELVLEADSLEGLDPDIAARLARALGLEAGQFRLVIQDQRSLTRNQEIAVERLRDRVAEALAPPPPPRRPTRPTRAARRQRLDEKTRRGSVKRQRRSPDEDNG
jgi:ribosome-associated protein